MAPSNGAGKESPDHKTRAEVTETTRLRSRIDYENQREEIREGVTTDDQAIVLACPSQSLQ